MGDCLFGSNGYLLGEAEVIQQLDKGADVNRSYNVKFEVSKHVLNVNCRLRGGLRFSVPVSVGARPWCGCYSLVEPKSI